MSVKIPQELRAKVAQEAHRRNVSLSTIVRESLEQVLAAPRKGREANCAELAGNLVGSVRSGRRDLSTNKKLLEDTVVGNGRRGSNRYR